MSYVLKIFGAQIPNFFMHYLRFSLLALSYYFCLVWARQDPIIILPRNRDSVSKLTRSEFVFGKDRELFHASIDLKWLVSIITNKSTWLMLLTSALEKIKRMNGEYDTLIKYRETASDILLRLRSCNEDTQLRSES